MLPLVVFTPHIWVFRLSVDIHLAAALQVHILPREILGASTFAVAMGMMKRFPLWFTDMLLVSYTRVMLGDTTCYGFSRPTDGPMAIKVKLGKTPVLDVGTFAKIKNGDIKVPRHVSSFFYHFK